MAEGFITRRGGKGGVDVSDANAVQSDVLQGKTFYAGTEDKKTGTIPSKTAQTFTPGTTNQTIAANQFLSGTQTILGDANLIPNNIRSGTTIFNVTGTLVPLTLTASGGTITTYTSGGKNYRVHTFTSSGNFVVSQGTSNTIVGNQVDYLIIAGGGGGGHGEQNEHAGGGGGAGGYRTTLGTSGANSSARPKVNVTNQTYGITIGGGGVGGIGSSVSGTRVSASGSNSSGLGVSTVGGGRGASAFGNEAAIGGSGGGGGGANFTGPTLGKSGTSLEGNTGGDGQFAQFWWNGGGGGGASSAGANFTGTTQSNGGGAGGNGLANLLRTGSNETRAGGGGGAGYAFGGAGGSGGGGAGGSNASITASNATTNTGSGGGGGHSIVSVQGSGGNGGSGIVVIRYEVA